MDDYEIDAEIAGRELESRAVRGKALLDACRASGESQALFKALDRMAAVDEDGVPRWGDERNRRGYMRPLGFPEPAIQTEVAAFVPMKDGHVGMNPYSLPPENVRHHYYDTLTEHCKFFVFDEDAMYGRVVDDEHCTLLFEQLDLVVDIVHSLDRAIVDGDWKKIKCAHHVLAGSCPDPSTPLALRAAPDVSEYVEDRLEVRKGADLLALPLDRRERKRFFKALDRLRTDRTELNVILSSAFERDKYMAYLKNIGMPAPVLELERRTLYVTHTDTDFECHSDECIEVYYSCVFSELGFLALELDEDDWKHGYKLLHRLVDILCMLDHAIVHRKWDTLKRVQSIL